MNRYVKDFRFDYKEIELKDLEIIEPNVVKHKLQGSYYILSNESAKLLFSGIHMKSRSFSKSLYSIDIPIWRNLLEKKLTNLDVKDFINSHKAIVMEDHVISIVDGNNNLPKLLDALDNFAIDDNVCYYKFNALEELVFLVVDKSSNTGVLIIYYTQTNWIVVNNIFINNVGLLCISPYKLYNNYVEEDIDIVLDASVILQGAKSMFGDESMKLEYEELLQVPLSAEELSWYMKSLFKIKMSKDSKPNLIEVAISMDLDSMIMNKISYLMTKLDNESEEVSSTYYSNSLKRSTTMTSINYGILADLIYCMVMKEKASMSLLYKMYNDLVRRKSHYFYIK